MLMEQILSRGNLLTALKRVEKNKGSHGVDEMPVQNLRGHIVKHWESLKMDLLEGTYEPQPVRRVEIPKPDGGMRLLGIPTVTDRFSSNKPLPKFYLRCMTQCFQTIAMDSGQIETLMKR